MDKAPLPKKADAVPQTPIMVVGDSMADWLAYGLEQAFTDSPEIGILRRHRTSSGLIRTTPIKGQVEFVADFGHAKHFFPDADVFPSVVVVRKPAEGEGYDRGMLHRVSSSGS